MDDPVDALPAITVLGLPPDHTEALQDVDYIVDTPSLNTQLLRALVKQKQIFVLFPVDAEKSPAKFAQRFFFAIVSTVILVEHALVSEAVECQLRLILLARQPS